MLTVSKTITFAAAHHLPNYNGPCQRLHGHEWKLTLFVRRKDGDIDSDTGMVLDFKLLKEQLQDEIIEVFDHRLINDQIGNPTAEQMTKHMVGLLSPAIQKLGCELVGLHLWETPDSCCQWSVDI